MKGHICVAPQLEAAALHLIVEVSAARCPQYSQVIDDIWAALEKNALTNQEAKDLRDKLCSKHGC